MPGIFISYRREDSAPYAGRLYDHLSSHFGVDNVFIDVDSIDPGVDFVDYLERRVGDCDVLIAVIGKQWLSIAGDQGQRRLDDPNDLVRIEIAAALNRNVRVVPALVEGARMPHADDLPEPLVPLVRRNALEISDLAFRQSVERLMASLDKVATPAAPVPGQGPTPLQPFAQPGPSNDLPGWRKQLLLFKPASPLGWVAVVLFWNFLIAMIISASTDNAGMTGSLFFLALICSLVGRAAKSAERKPSAQ